MSEFRPFSEQQQKAQALLGDKDATDIMLLGGARSGKSFMAVRAIVVRALKAPGSDHLIVRRFFRDARTKIGMGTLPDVLNACFPMLDSGTHWDKKDWIVTLPNKSRLWIGGLDEHSIDRVLGGEYSTVCFEEASELDEEAVDNALTRLAQKNDLRNVAYYTMNPGLRMHWTNERFIEKPRRGHKWIRLNPGDNIHNIDPTFIRRLENLPEKQRQRFLFGEFQDPDEGALWRMEWIRDTRVERSECPSGFDRIVVSVDPAVTSQKNSDDTGIVICARLDDQFYVLGDHTMNAPPAEWAQEAVRLYLGHGADTLVYESNQGGEMTPTIVNGLDPSVRLAPVWATQSKRSRAEPVAAFYERGLVHHVGALDALELELVTYTGDGKSPNRLDALVHGLTFLGCTQSTVIPHVGGGSDAEDEDDEGSEDFDRLWGDNDLWS